MTIFLRLFSMLAMAAQGALLAGCFAPSERLRFPEAPVAMREGGRDYDMDADGRADFSILPGDDGRLGVLAYDDDQDGRPDRVYRTADAGADAPHLIILFDSIPFEPVRRRCESAGWTWFGPPVKVIPPFPTMSPVIFSRLLGAPPQRGAINQFYDRAEGRPVDRIGERIAGDANPWERRLHYRLEYWQNGLAFLEPRAWFHAELALAKAAFDASPDRVTLVYFASTACMLSKYGERGLEECLDGLERLSLQVLYERRGAVQISATADHGHTLVPGTRVDVPDILRAAGYTPGDRMGPGRVVVELDGLVNYVGVHTIDAPGVAAALTARPEIELAMYLSGERVIVRSAAGSAAVECRDGRHRYAPIDADVLGYAPVIEALRAGGKLDADGFAAPEDWFAATLDHRWPDSPRRLWDAFHGVVVNTPDVMATTRRGHYAGLASMGWFIDMASTHGGLDQDDSATFLLTTTGRARGPLRTEDVLRTVEPRYDPSVLRR